MESVNVLKFFKNNCWLLSYVSILCIYGRHNWGEFNECQEDR